MWILAQPESSEKSDNSSIYFDMPDRPDIMPHRRKETYADRLASALVPIGRAGALDGIGTGLWE
jgi:restriction endonuclease Mrr